MAHNHLRGLGCPDCAESGFNPSMPGLLYYIAIKTDDELISINDVYIDSKSRHSTCVLKKIPLKISRNKKISLLYTLISEDSIYEEIVYDFYNAN